MNRLLFGLIFISACGNAPSRFLGTTTTEENASTSSLNAENSTSVKSEPSATAEVKSEKAVEDPKNLPQPLEFEKVELRESVQELSELLECNLKNGVKRTLAPKGCTRFQIIKRLGRNNPIEFATMDDADLKCRELGEGWQLARIASRCDVIDAVQFNFTTDLDHTDMNQGPFIYNNCQEVNSLTWEPYNTGLICGTPDSYIRLTWPGVSSCDDGRGPEALCAFDDTRSIEMLNNNSLLCENTKCQSVFE